MNLTNLNPQDFQSTVSLPPPASIPAGLSPGSLSSAGGSIRESLHHALCTQCQILEKILIKLWVPSPTAHLSINLTYFFCIVMRPGAYLKELKDEVSLILVFLN